MRYHSSLVKPPDGEWMSFDELHAFLTAELGLVADVLERGNGRTYFWKKVIWLPASTTRIARVQHSADGIVTHIRLSVSSDNNNSVFIPVPFETDNVRAAIARELALLHEMNGAAAG
jgi:hypothetical protein